MPAKAGIQLIGESLRDALDACFRRHDNKLERLRVSSYYVSGFTLPFRLFGFNAL